MSKTFSERDQIRWIFNINKYFVKIDNFLKKKLYIVRDKSLFVCRVECSSWTVHVIKKEVIGFEMIVHLRC